MYFLEKVLLSKGVVYYISTNVSSIFLSLKFYCRRSIGEHPVHDARTTTLTRTPTNLHVCVFTSSIIVSLLSDIQSSDIFGEVEYIIITEVVQEHD